MPSFAVGFKQGTEMGNDILSGVYKMKQMKIAQEELDIKKAEAGLESEVAAAAVDATVGGNTADPATETQVGLIDKVFGRLGNAAAANDLQDRKKALGTMSDLADIGNLPNGPVKEEKLNQFAANYEQETGKPVSNAFFNIMRKGKPEDLGPMLSVAADAVQSSDALTMKSLSQMISSDQGSADAFAQLQKVAAQRAKQMSATGEQPGGVPESVRLKQKVEREMKRVGTQIKTTQDAMDRIQQLVAMGKMRPTALNSKTYKNMEKRLQHYEDRMDRLMGREVDTARLSETARGNNIRLLTVMTKDNRGAMEKNLDTIMRDPKLSTEQKNQARLKLFGIEPRDEYDLKAGINAEGKRVWTYMPKTPESKKPILYTNVPAPEDPMTQMMRQATGGAADAAGSAAGPAQPGIAPQMKEAGQAQKELEQAISAGQFPQGAHLVPNTISGKWEVFDSQNNPIGVLE